MAIASAVKKKIFQNEFNRHVLTLMTGTTVAQAIPIVISPILTRIYTPEDFGVLALFVTIATIFGSIANGRYELAIVLPEKDEDAINITALAILVALCVSGFLFLLVLLFHQPMVRWLNNEHLSVWLYFVPLVVFLTGLFNALNYFYTRTKNYRHISKANIYKALMLSIVQLSLGFLKAGAAGLLTGQILSNMAGNGTLGFKLLKDKQLLSHIRKSEMKRLAKRYADFPKYSIWAVLANTLSQNLTNLFISAVYSASTLGFYSLVNRVLGMPSALIGTAVGQVYFQKATEEKNKTGKALRSFKTTFLKLFFLSLPVFGTLYFVVEDLFVIVFGKEWEIAGRYAQIVIPLFFIRFIFTPLSTTTTVFEKQKLGLFYQLSLFALVLMVAFIAFYTDLGVEGFLYLYTIVIGLRYVLVLFYLYKLSRGKRHDS